MRGTSLNLDTIRDADRISAGARQDPPRGCAPARPSLQDDRDLDFHIEDRREPLRQLHAGDADPFVLPYAAEVHFQGRVRRMERFETTTGDCNTCHTQDGAMNAPGRIVVP